MNIQSSFISEERFTVNDFMNVVATGLWPVNLGPHSCHWEDDPQSRGYSGYSLT